MPTLKSDIIPVEIDKGFVRIRTWLSRRKAIYLAAVWRGFLNSIIGEVSGKC